MNVIVTNSPQRLRIGLQRVAVDHSGTNLGRLSNPAPESQLGDDSLLFTNLSLEKFSINTEASSVG